VTFWNFLCNLPAFTGEIFKMRKLLLAATMALGCGAAHAETLTQAAPPAAEPAQAAPAPQAAPAAVPAPQAAAPETAPAPAAKPSKPARKQQVRRRESDEAKARRIAAKYGVSW
jgi:outer membrane biosynthesis protein TonB